MPPVMIGKNPRMSMPLRSIAPSPMPMKSPSTIPNMGDKVRPMKMRNKKNKIRIK